MWPLAGRQLSQKHSFFCLAPTTSKCRFVNRRTGQHYHYYPYYYSYHYYSYYYSYYYYSYHYYFCFKSGCYS